MEAHKPRFCPVLPEAKWDDRVMRARRSTPAPSMPIVFSPSDRFSLHRRRGIEPISCAIDEYRSRPCLRIAVAFRLCNRIETRILAVDQYLTVVGLS